LVRLTTVSSKGPTLFRTFGAPNYSAYLIGLARASVLNGDSAKARKAYQDFLALWKDADVDLPILQQAKDEYEHLK